jgi:excisionase family DNA binding protein
VDQMLLRVDEAAHMLRIPRSRLYQMLSRGDVPAVRLGRSLRVPADALKRWVEDRAGATTAPK